MISGLKISLKLNFEAGYYRLEVDEEFFGVTRSNSYSADQSNLKRLFAATDLGFHLNGIST